MFAFSFSIGEYLPRKIFDYFIENNISYLSEFFIRADEEIAKDLVCRCSSSDHSDEWLNWVYCIAAIPCETSKNFLLELNKTPHLDWTNEPVWVLDFSTFYGWCINNNQAIEKLYSDKVQVFESVIADSGSDLAPLVHLAETCQYCGQPLTLIYETEKAQKLTTFLFCSCWETIYTKKEGESVHWHKKNDSETSYKNNCDTSDIEYKLKLTDEVRHPKTSIHELICYQENQIGGMPTLTAGVIDYPICPDCVSHMKFTAQYRDRGYNAGAGTYYFFTCDDCKVAACNHMNT